MGFLMRDVAIRATSLLQHGRSQQRLRETGDVRRRPGQGKKRATSVVDDQFLTLNSLRDSTTTAVQLRRLEHANLYVCRPARCPILLPYHRRARLAFCHECEFSVQGAAGQQIIWRRPDDRFADRAIVEKSRFGGSLVIVYGDICVHGSTDLIVHGRPVLNTHRYIEEVLQDHVVPFALIRGPDFLLIQENARPNAATVVDEVLNDVDIHRLDWPVCSLALIPTECFARRME
ncbi:hypothetical protein Trydic_g7268 [Trypoxylus dichotomus]